MAKATRVDILNEGWAAEQFGASAATFAADNGLIDTELGRAGRWAADQFGTTAYATVSAATAVHDRLVMAETEFVNAAFFRRRARHIDAAANASLTEQGYLTVREMISQADAAMARAEQLLAEAIALNGGTGAAPGYGFSITAVETGRFPAVIE